MCSGNANPVVVSFRPRCLGLYSVQQDAGCLHIGNHVHELQQCYAVECPLPNPPHFGAIKAYHGHPDAIAGLCQWG